MSGMRKLSLLLVFLALGAAAPPRPVDALAGRLLGTTPLFDDLEELTGTIGGRPAGSPACARAVAWAAQKFRDAGVDRVAVEPYLLPDAWVPQSADGDVVAPEHFALRRRSAVMRVGLRRRAGRRP